MRRRHRTGVSARVVAVVVAGVAAMVAGGTAELAGFLPGLEQGSISQRFERRGPQPAPDVLVVAIDEKSFDDLRLQWPFPRRWHARAIDRLRRDGARAIVYDVQFTERTRARDDRALADAVGRAGNVVLATAETDEHGHTNILGGDDVLAQLGAQAGASNLPSGQGGVLQRFEPESGGLQTLAMAAARVAGHAPDPSAFDRGGAWIDLPRPARDDRDGVVLGPRQRAGESVGRARAHRGRRRRGGHAAGRPSDADRLGRADARPRDRSQRDPHRRPRPAAARRAPLGGPPRDRPHRAFPGRGEPPAARAALGARRARGGRRLARDRAGRVRPRARAARGGAALRLGGRHRADDRPGLRVREPSPQPGGAAQRGARGGGARAHRRASRDPAGDHRPAGRRDGVARRGDRPAPRAHRPAVRAARAGARDDRGRGRDAAPRQPPARRRQGRRPRCDPHQAGSADRRGGGGHARPRRRRRDDARRLARPGDQDGRGDRAHAPRAMGRHRVPERPGRRGDPAGRADLRVCDVFDALRSQRPYKEPWPLRDALDELARERGRHFDPVVLDAFLGMVDRLDPALLAAHEAPGSLAPRARDALLS